MIVRVAAPEPEPPTPPRTIAGDDCGVNELMSWVHSRDPHVAREPVRDLRRALHVHPEPVTRAEVEHLIGKRVTVTEWFGPPSIEVSGVLLDVEHDGTAVVRADDGIVGYHWPALKIEESSPDS